MPHHVAVGEVQADEIELLLVQFGHQFVLHLVSAHFGLQVVSGHFGRRNQNPLLSFESFLATAIEKERHMGVFFRLGDAQLLESLLRHILADRIDDVLLVEQDVQSLELRIVRRHAAIIERQPLHAELGHILLRQCDRQFLRTVIAEIEEDHDVAFADRAERTVLAVDADDRLDELVRHTLSDDSATLR